jgi:cystathionine beta-lyase/cystathionine gamma-synthase
MPSQQTRILSRKVDQEGVRASVTPLFRNSAFEEGSEYFYLRKDHPNVREFEAHIADLEQSKYATAYASGMAAIAAVLDLCPKGSTVAINDLVYGCTYKLFTLFCQKLDIDLISTDLSNPKNIEALGSNIEMIFFETPTNPFLKNIEIAQVRSIASKLNPKVKIVVDNTWATPLNQTPLSHGADISLHSATKYFSGHSDCMGGIACTSSELIHNKFREYRFYYGAVLSPDNAWLLTRSLQTLPVRMKTHIANLQSVVAHLKDRDFIDKIYLPEVGSAQLQQYGGIFFAELKGSTSQIEAFTKSLNLFDTGTAMACVKSMVARPYFGSHASLSEDQKNTMGITPNLVRFCIGLEDPQDLIDDIEATWDAVKSQ